MRATFLKGSFIGISISESPDMGVRGFGKEHLDDAMTEIARHLIACGASLAYGGDLREGGFTELLFEIVNRYRLNQDSERILVKNYLAWPVHASMPAKQISDRKSALEGLAELVLLTAEGDELDASDRTDAATPPGQIDWENGLTAMRKTMATRIDARIVLGGRTIDFKGRLPGIAEEALIQIRRKSPLFVLGGFGGCSLDIARALGFGAREVLEREPWKGIELFHHFRPPDLRNGLTERENQRLAETTYVDEAVALILRGLSKRPHKKRARAPTRRK
jgi:hypothetical protein